MVIIPFDNVIDTFFMKLASLDLAHIKLSIHAILFLISRVIPFSEQVTFIGLHDHECVDVYISAAHLMDSTKLVSQLRKELQVCENYRA